MLPLVLCFSSPHWVWFHLVFLMVACCGLLVVARLGQTNTWSLSNMRLAHAFTWTDEAGTRMRCVAEYRAVIMITTCIAILAVDFPSVFSRSHAKTEEYGFSLMDLGTGCIICSSAVCSKAARGIQQARRARALLGRAASLWPVLAIGSIRFAVVWGVDYHVPLSEYGVHWNFFFTIAVVGLLSTLADLPPVASGVAGIALLIVYEVFLTCFGGAEYILQAPRIGWFSANREGVLSCFGFLGVHWVAVALGSMLRSVNGPASNTLAILILVVVSSACALLLLQMLGMNVSRRFCNLPYAMLTISINAMVLGSLALVDLCWPRPRPELPLAFAGVQSSQFAVFLAANLLTGLVNISMQPLLVPWWAAILIMVAYSTAWTVPFGVLSAKGIALRFV